MWSGIEVFINKAVVFVNDTYWCSVVTDQLRSRRQGDRAMSDGYGFSSMVIDELERLEREYPRNRTPQQLEESLYWKALNAELRNRVEFVDVLIDELRITPLVR